MDHIEIVYTFEAQGREKFVYPIRLHQETSLLMSDRQRVPPEWTALDNFQCAVCPLNSKRDPYCPVAVNIDGVVNYFNDFRSTDRMQITVTTRERVYSKEAPAQRGLASILGVIMATSGCPVMNFLKPLARYHLPFSTSKETVIRVTSMYLLAQYFVTKRGGNPDISLDRLHKAYADVRQVNEGISKRIDAVVKKNDAPINAVIILHTLSQILGLEIDDKLDSLEPLFTGLQM